MVPNLDAVVNELREKLSRSTFSKWTIEIFQPENFSTFSSQVNFVSNSSVLIGVHGAALTYAIYLPAHANLIEIFYGDRNVGNWHFHNIAKFLGLEYRTPGYLGKQGANIKTEKIWPLLKAALESINK